MTEIEFVKESHLVKLPHAAQPYPGKMEVEDAEERCGVVQIFKNFKDFDEKTRQFNFWTGIFLGETHNVRQHIIDHNEDFGYVLYTDSFEEAYRIAKELQTLKKIEQEALQAKEAKLREGE